MADEISDAIESARSAGLTGEARLGADRPIHSATKVRAIVKAFLRELPEDLTVREILEDL